MNVSKHQAHGRNESAAAAGRRRSQPILLSGMILLGALTGLSACDSKSSGDTSSETPNHSVVSTETPPPRPISANALPFSADELNVIAAFPGPAEPRVALVSPISVSFDAPLLQGQNLANAIRVTATSGEVSGTISQSADDTLVFRADELLSPNTQYKLAIHSNLMSVDGLLVNEELHWDFVTVTDVHTTPQSIIDMCMSERDEEMLAAVNQVRSVARACGNTEYPATGKLSWNCRLQDAAITHSQDMAINDFFEHVGSDGSKEVQRIDRAGYAASYAGENLAAGYSTVAAALDGLLGSVDHCIILMTPEFTEFGLGYAFAAKSEHRHYWTQNFARPAARR